MRYVKKLRQCLSLEKYMVPVSVWKGRLNGAVTFILPQGTELENHDLITFFIREVAGFLSRRDAEAALKESDQFTREIIHNAKEGIVVYDRNFNYLIWNPFMESITGIPASEARGKNALELFPHLREQKVEILMQRALNGETVRSPDIPYYIQKTGKIGVGIRYLQSTFKRSGRDYWHYCYYP